MPSLHWRRVWKTEPWIRRLFGATLAPSLADAFVDAWTCSLQATRVSLNPLQANASALTIPATCGRLSGASLSAVGPRSSSLKTWTRTSPAHTGERGETFSDLVTRLRRDSLARRKRAAASAAYDCSSWASPTTRDFKRGDLPERSGSPSLSVQADSWPAPDDLWNTPRASDSVKGSPLQKFGGGGMPLPSQTALARRKAKHAARGIRNGVPLTQAAQRWPAAVVADSRDTRNATAKRAAGSTANAGVTLTDAISLFDRQDQATATPGAPSPTSTLQCYRRYRATTCSSMRSELRALLLMGIRARGPGWTRHAPAVFVRPSFRRRLNLHFVEWLMQWPRGWTGSACSEMELTRWRRLMRSELLQLSAQPVVTTERQLSLLG